MIKTAKSSAKSPAPVAKKVFDVAKPGKSAATATSKPVIITNRPVMQDPMMVAEQPADTVPSAPPLTPTKKIIIKPLDDELTTVSVPASISPASAPATTVTVEDTATEQPVSVAVIPKSSPVVAERSVSDEPTVPIDKSLPVTESVKIAIDPSVTPAPAAMLPASKPDVASSPKTGVPATDEALVSVDPTATQAMTDEATRQHRAAVQKLVNSEQYFLPINHLEKRRTRRFVLLGLLLIVVLAVAWADVALDAGLIANAHNLPHSHFFTAK